MAKVKNKLQKRLSKKDKLNGAIAILVKNFGIKKAEQVIKRQMIYWQQVNKLLQTQKPRTKKQQAQINWAQNFAKNGRVNPNKH